MKTKLKLVFSQSEGELERTLRMAGCLGLRELVSLMKDLGFVFGKAELLHLEMLTGKGVVERIATKGGLVLYKWPNGGGMGGVGGEVLDGDELHERLYTTYGVKSFTLSKASKELSLDRGMVEKLVDSLVKEGRLKEQGVRKFMGHPFQTYKVV